MNALVGRAKFARQLYNLRHELETDEETEGVEVEIQRLQETIDQYDKPMKSFYTKDSVDDRRAGGGAGGISATDCAELGAHGSEMKPEVIVNDNSVHYNWPLNCKCGLIDLISRPQIRSRLTSSRRMYQLIPSSGTFGERNMPSTIPS